jgi:hypothetical protein
MTTTQTSGLDIPAAFRESMKQTRNYSPSGRLVDCQDKIGPFNDLKKALIQWCLSRPGHEPDIRGILAYNFFLSAADYAAIFGAEQPLVYPLAALPDLAANATNAAVFLRQKEETSRKLVSSDVSFFKAIVMDQAGKLLDPLKHAATGLGLVTPAQLWNHLDAQYGLAAISGDDISRFYDSTKIPFDRTLLLSENIYRDVAAYNQVVELLGAEHATPQMQMLRDLTDKTKVYHLTAASWVADYNQATPAIARTYDGLQAFLIRSETRHDGSLVQLGRANPLVAPTEAAVPVSVAHIPDAPATALAAYSAAQPPSRKQKAWYCFGCGYGRYSGRQCPLMHDYSMGGALKAPYTEAMVAARTHLDANGLRLKLPGTDGKMITACTTKSKHYE